MRSKVIAAAIKITSTRGSAAACMIEFLDEFLHIDSAGTVPDQGQAQLRLTPPIPAQKIQKRVPPAVVSRLNDQSMNSFISFQISAAACPTRIASSSSSMTVVYRPWPCPEFRRWKTSRSVTERRALGGLEKSTARRGSLLQT